MESRVIHFRVTRHRHLMSRDHSTLHMSFPICFFSF